MSVEICALQWSAGHSLSLRDEGSWLCCGCWAPIVTQVSGHKLAKQYEVMEVAMKAAKVAQEEKKTQKKEKEKEEKEAAKIEPGENKDEKKEEKKDEKDPMKKLSKEKQQELVGLMVEMMWRTTVLDIEDTLRHVLWRVCEDRGISKEVTLSACLFPRFGCAGRGREVGAEGKRARCARGAGPKPRECPVDPVTGPHRPRCGVGPTQRRNVWRAVRP